LAINTKRVARRSLRFQTMPELLDDIEAVMARPHTTTGNWTAPQIIDHVTKLIDVSLHGSDQKMALPFRVLGNMMKKRLLTKPLKPGFKAPAFMQPRNEAGGLTVNSVMGRSRALIQRASEPGTMTHPSPFLGEMTHDEWVQMHCRHAELHFSFIQPV